MPGTREHEEDSVADINPPQRGPEGEPAASSVGNSRAAGVPDSSDRVESPLAGPYPQVRCDQCQHDVPLADFCVRCGHDLHDERERADGGRRRQRFSAAPEEPARAIRVFSTLFPQLPRAEMDTFRVATAIGVAVMVGLALGGLFPVAVMAAAILVPLLMVLYLYDVDVYENEPLRVYVATMAWGVVTGAITGLVVRDVLPGPSVAAFSTPLDLTILRGVLVPLVGLALMLLGPLFLMRNRKFNDVLDGATFGAASAVCYVGAQVITQAVDLFANGLRPPGDPLPWVLRLLSLGIATPILAAGAVGATAAALWLRFRAPVADRHLLGPLGSPLVAFLVAAILLVTGALAQLFMNLALSLAVLAVLAVVALLWLRMAIHLGLLEESREIEIGGVIQCPNCAHPTPFHSFCGHCGISLRALPKVRPRRPTGTTPSADRAGGTS